MVNGKEGCHGLTHVTFQMKCYGTRKVKREGCALRARTTLAPDDLLFLSILDEKLIQEADPSGGSYRRNRTVDCLGTLHGARLGIAYDCYDTVK